MFIANIKMIVKKNNYTYSSKRTMIYGRGFVDTLKGIGSYVSQNKDLLAKPMLGAVGDIGAFALAEGSKALIRKALAEKPKDKLSSESRQILESLKSGSGLKRF